jgi:branched-chain amino acid transport system ATP-binding protein
MTANGMPLLSVRNVSTYYGKIVALRGVDVEVHAGEIVALIGANGAGKSTSLNTISGLLHPTSGSIRFREEYITTTTPQDIVRKGIIQVPEGRRIFSSMSVWENLEMGAYTQNNRAEIKARMGSVFERFPRLKERRAQAGGTLSGGEQQMLAIARALMADPTVLLLDEPSMGLAPILVEQIFDIIREINESGTSIVLVEQNALMALSIADRGYVLDTGRVALEGSSDDLLHNPMVINAYLGGETTD